MWRWITVGLFITLTGCIATGTKVEESTLLQFERGHTTYAEALAILGRPNQNILYADGSRQMLYTYTQQQLKVQNFIPIVAAFYQGATNETTTVTLQFDTRQLLTGFTATSGQTAVGTGITSGARQ